MLADPDLAQWLERLGMLLVEESEGTAGVTPEVKTRLEVSAECRHIGDENRHVDVFVLALDACGSFERMTADKPPRTFEALHERLKLERGKRLPGPVNVPEVDLIRDFGGGRHGAPAANAPRASPHRTRRTAPRSGRGCSRVPGR